MWPQRTSCGCRRYCARSSARRTLPSRRAHFKRSNRRQCRAKSRARTAAGWTTGGDMAVGDNIGTFSSVANNGTKAVQPSSSIHWTVTTLICEQGLKTEVYLADDASGTNKKLLETIYTPQHALTYQLRNDLWLELKNVSGSTQFLGFMGKETK